MGSRSSESCAKALLRARTNVEDQTSVKELGAAQFLAKSFSLSDLEKTLENAGA
jgi:DNA-binding response OmpR family regulator